MKSIISSNSLRRPTSGRSHSTHALTVPARTGHLLFLLSWLVLFAFSAWGQTINPLRLNCPPDRTNWICGVNSTTPVVYPPPTTAGGNCTLATTVLCSPPSGALFILGTTTVTCTATNLCGERASCSFQLTVARDTVAPDIDCPTNRVVWLCGTAATTPVLYPLPTATDNADPNVSVTCAPPSGSLFPAGTSTVNCTAVDNCTNRASCTFTITVVRDVTPPAITCPSNISVIACFTAGAAVDYPVPAATDNIDPSVEVECVPKPGSVFPSGITTVTCTATDDCTNRTSCTFQVRVTPDTVPPLIQCPSNIVLRTCGTNAITHYGVTAEDNLDPDVVITCSPPVGTPLPVGDTTVTCTAVDDCRNSSECSFQVRVIRDTTPPAIECPSNMVFNCLCPGTAIALDFFKPTVSDDHDPNPTIVCAPPSLISSPGVHLVTCTATDNCGNSNRCSFTVTFNYDTTPPALTCPTNMTVWSCSNSAIIQYSATATDACDTNVAVVCTPPSGGVFPVGLSTVLCAATDRCTNRATCTFTVEVRRDTVPPVIQCPTNRTVFSCTNFAVVKYEPAATDNVDPDVTVICTPPSGSKFPLGQTTVVCTATDSCGNTGRCTFDVTVRIPRLNFTPVPDGVLLTWPEGTELQEALRVTGPWHYVEDAQSPLLVKPEHGQRFYRLADSGDGYCPGVQTNPRLADELSRMHYASVHVREEFEEYEDVSPEPSTNRHPARVPVYDPRPGDGYSWNSAVGRRFLLEIGDVGEDREGAASHAHGSVEQQIAEGVESPFCVNPSFYVSAGDRVFSGWSDQTFQAPMNAFATKAEAEAFLLKIHAEQPFFLPFTHPDVRLGHGWYYNSGGLHRACDYSRTGVEENEDPTFLVKSAGNGVVVATDWDGNGGNYVAVESTAPGGQKVMFVYLHLRDGRSHDVAKAKSSTSDSEKYVKYRAFANNYPNHLSWGTDDHTIKVQVGDHVSIGTPLAWAGNTGAGGAGSGLNADGSPENWKGNLHLHVYVAVPHPTVQDTWVWVDPYGVYQEVDTGCYDLLKDTKFSRLYAPFHSTFHGVPYEIFKFYWGYYPNMGMKLRTLSVHRDGNSLLASGSFQSGVPGGWFLHTYKTAQEFQDFANDHYAQGYIMRETTVEKTLGGQPRFSAIWRPLEPGETIEHRAQLTDAEWGTLWQDRVVEDEWRLEDYFGYSVGGVNYQSVLVTSHQGRPFLYSGLMTSSDLDETIDDYKSDGYLPVSFNAASRAGGLRFSGIFRNLPGCWKVRWGLTPAEYQSYVSQQSALGYRVWKIQGYSDSNRYGVVLHDPTGPCQ